MQDKKPTMSRVFAVGGAGSMLVLLLASSLPACSDTEEAPQQPKQQIPPCTVSTCAKAEEACSLTPLACPKDAEQNKADPATYKAECVYLITQTAEQTHKENPNQQPDTMVAEVVECLKIATTCEQATKCLELVKVQYCNDDCP